MKHYRKQDLLTVAFDESIDFTNASDVKNQVRDLLQAYDRHLIIDLGEVRMINTNALAVLNHCRAMYKERGARLAQPAR